MPYGTYTAVIRGKAGENQDAIEYKFSIIESAQEVKHKETVNGIQKEVEGGTISKEYKTDENGKYFTGNQCIFLCTI